MRFALPFVSKPLSRMGDHVHLEGKALTTLLAATPSPDEAVDIAYNNVTVNGQPPDWSKVSPFPVGVITKAGEWGSEDPTFGPNWTALGKMGKPRAAYWFFRFNQLFYTASRQAATFVNIVKKYGGFGPNDYFVIDAEEQSSSGQSLLSISQIIDFLYNVQIGLGLPDTSHLLIYSTASLLNNLNFIKLSSAQVAWVGKIRIWTAGYPFNPDAVLTPPAAYIPDQSRYGQVVMWQKAEGIPAFNIPGGCDLNWVDPDFKVEWSGGAVVPPTPPPTPATVQLAVTVESASPVKLDSVVLNGADVTTSTSLNVIVTSPAPIPAPIPTPVPVPAPAPELNLYRVLWMFQRPSTLAPAVVFQKPDVLAGRLNSQVPLTQELQLFWFHLLQQKAPTGWDVAHAWRSLTGSHLAFTNESGTDVYRDWISQRNMTMKDAWLDKFRVCGGNVVNVLKDSNGVEIKQTVLGIPCYRVQAIDPTSHPDAAVLNHSLTPHLVHLATIDFNASTVGAFPQLDGNDVQYPLLGVGGWNLIPVACLEKVTGDTPSPYLPAR